MARIPSIGIIGAGFSGMSAFMEIKKQLGIYPRMFDANDDVGGTWLVNSYPSCACDIPSGLYSFSGEPNPDWTYTYSHQPEILEYMRSVARKHKMYEHTSFGTSVHQVTWIEERKQYKVDYSDRSDPNVITTEYFDIMFAGLGPLRIPHVPEQFKSFTGTSVHTTEWDPSIDFNNKVVAVIGNGASAVQAIPDLQKQAKHLVSYQRSATWIASRYQFKYPRILKFLFNWFPILLRFQRYLLYVIHELTFPLFKFSSSFFARFVRWLFAFEMRQRLKKCGREDLAPVLTPKYAVGCKRIARSELFLEALAQPNVSVKMGHVTKIEGQTIHHDDGSAIEADILVLSTGFEVSGFLGNLKIYGRNNVELNSLWGAGDYPRTYKTTNVHNFPNFFLLLGPNSGLGHNSVILMIETQVRYALSCIKYMMRNNIQAIEPKLASQDQFADNMVKRMKGTTWLNGGCTSYYKKDDFVFALWPSSVAAFWLEMKFKKNDFIHYK